MKGLKLYLTATEIHDDNCKRGFYDDIHRMAETIEDAETYDKIESMFINQQLLLTITEISEAVEYARKNGIDLSLDPFSELQQLSIPEGVDLFEKKYKDTFQDELADTFIRLFDLIGYLDIHIDDWIKAKLAYNRQRPYKHGKKF